MAQRKIQNMKYSSNHRLLKHIPEEGKRKEKKNQDLSWLPTKVLSMYWYKLAHKMCIIFSKKKSKVHGGVRCCF